MATIEQENLKKANQKNTELYNNSQFAYEELK